MQGLTQPKIKNILVVILMILSSTLAGCVTDNGPPTIEEENENNNDMENETSNNILENTSCDNLDIDAVKAALAEEYGIDPALISFPDPCPEGTDDRENTNQTGECTWVESPDREGEFYCDFGEEDRENITQEDCELRNGTWIEAAERPGEFYCDLGEEWKENMTQEDCELRNGTWTESPDQEGEFYCDLGEDDSENNNNNATIDDDADGDGDGMPDDWELDHGLDPSNAFDADWCAGDWTEGDDDGVCNDGDNDGLSNLEEYLNSTDPTNPDTDGDGMPDGWEVVFGLDPLNALDADMDGDMDNLTNLEEFAEGNGPNMTNPNDPDSDGDGENDDTDMFPQDPNNGQYVDSDQDGYNDSEEIDCQSNPQDFNSIPQDTDGDGICDPLDPINNLITMWGNNSAHFLYVKPDPHANSNVEDAIPYQIEFVANPMAEQNPVILTQICFKNQGHEADVWSAFVLGPFPYDIISWKIYNTNGINLGMFVSNDNLSASSNMTFPTVISTQDVENQSNGHLEAEVIDLQFYTCQLDITDSDNDGILDWMDAFPNDPNEWEDLDGDGIGNNADLDDDGDTCDDVIDWAPLIAAECFDTDGDGVGDNTDSEPWINNSGNGTFSMNYTMIGVASGHELYWLSQDPECPCYAYYYSTTPDMVWVDGIRSPVISQEYMPNVDVILALMGLTIDNLTVSTHPVNLGTDTQGIEWDYDSNTGVEWRQLSSNLSILYIDDKPLFSINASMMLYLDYSPMMLGNSVTMTGTSSFSPITSVLTANDALIYHQLFNAFFEDFGENYINYSFTSQDAIITNDYSFWDSADPTQTTWLSSLIENHGSIPGGLFDSVVSEVNVEPNQTGVTMSKLANKTPTKFAVFSERDEKEESIY